MNVCILYGKIITEIEFEFIINSKNKSIVHFKIELLNKSIVEAKAYNKIADYIYKVFQKEDMICIYGQIDSNGKVIICEVEKLKK